MNYKKHKSKQSKVLNNIYQKMGYEYLMSGTYYHHIGLKTPNGLNREFYRIIDIEKDDIFDESNLELVKYRKRIH